MTSSGIEPERELRCQSDYLEVLGRTHECKLTLMHDGNDHECICAVRWPRRKPVGA